MFSDRPLDYEKEIWWHRFNDQMPEYWLYCKNHACHWIANFALELAQLVEPNRPWRIIYTRAHSTVWDGDKLLFDFLFQALDQARIPGARASDCFEQATNDTKTRRVLKVGEHRNVMHSAYLTRVGEFEKKM